MAYCNKNVTQTITLLYCEIYLHNLLCTKRIKMHFDSQYVACITYVLTFTLAILFDDYV